MAQEQAIADHKARAQAERVEVAKLGTRPEEVIAQAYSRLSLSELSLVRAMQNDQRELLAGLTR